MFSKNRSGSSGAGAGGGGKGRIFGLKIGSSKKQSSKHWAQTNKQRNEQKEKPRLDPLVDEDDDTNAGVMTSSESSPTLQATVSPTQYPELPDEPRPGKIRPSTPTTSNNTNTTNSSLSPSPRAGTHSTTSSLGNNNRSSGGDSPEVEAIEEAVPIVRTTLPSPEPRPLIERNGYKGSALKLDNDDKVDGDIKFKQPPRDVDEDSCIIKCVYFTQQCCECTII